MTSQTCKCSRGCKAVVVTAGAKYARGHNPRTRNSMKDVKARQQHLKETMTVTEYEAYLRTLPPRATNKHLTRCPYGCGFEDGTRAMLRHKPVCPKRPQ